MFLRLHPTGDEISDELPLLVGQVAVRRPPRLAECRRVP
jgi:hypothetical protein